MRDSRGSIDVVIPAWGRYLAFLHRGRGLADRSSWDRKLRDCLAAAALAVATVAGGIGWLLGGLVAALVAVGSFAAARRF